MAVTARLPEATGVEWVTCPGCHSVVYAKRWHRQMRVCLECGRHDRLPAPDRLAQILDPGFALILDVTSPGIVDPLTFTDSLPYPDRVMAARASSGLPEAVLCARGRIAGTPVVAAVMDFRFLGGSLGSCAGELITRAAETSLIERAPLILVTASGGARMQEGVFSLMQMAKTSQALRQLDEAGVLTICVVTDPTYGGVAASFATLCDIIIAEPGARLGFAGPRVIQQTIGEILPRGFQTAEFLLARGLIDAIRPRDELRAALGRMVSTGTRRARPACGDDAEDGQSCLTVDWRQVPGRDPWESVQQARALGRPTTLDYINLMMTDFEELNGDRVSGDCSAMVAGLGRLRGIPIVVIGHQKGHSAAQLTERNFGMATPAGYRKAARLMRLAAKLGLPVVTLVDTPGAYPGIKAEEQGQAFAIAENLRLMAGLPVPVVAVITGEGGSGGALALAVADQVLMCENAIYSVISPEGCAAILWNDAAAAPAAAASLRLGARELLRLGVVDAVVREPPGGAQADHEQAAERLEAALVARLGRLAALDAPALVHRRWSRFRAFGLDAGVPADIAASGHGPRDG